MKPLKFILAALCLTFAYSQAAQAADTHEISIHVLWTESCSGKDVGNKTLGCATPLPLPKVVMFLRRVNSKSVQKIQIDKFGMANLRLVAGTYQVAFDETSLDNTAVISAYLAGQCGLEGVASDTNLKTYNPLLDPGHTLLKAKFGNALITIGNRPARKNIDISGSCGA